MEKRATDYVKTGMTVKLRSDLKVDGIYGSDYFVSDMKDFAGQKVCVSYVPRVPLSSKCVDRFRIVGSNYNFTVDMIENPRSLSESSSESNKSELENKPKGGIQFKTGDTVKLRSDLKVGKRYGNLTYLDGMGEPGSEFVVSRLISNGDMNLEGSLYFYSPEMFESKKDQPKVVKDQKESKMVIDMREIKLQVGDVVKIRTDIVDGQVYGDIRYTKYMIAGGRTAKVTRVSTAFRGKIVLYTLDKDKDSNYYTLDMFDLDYILTRNPRFAQEKQQQSEKEVEKPTLEIHVGNLVRLRDDLKTGTRYGADTFTVTMAKNRGKIVEVARTFGSGKGQMFTITGDTGEYHYTPEMVAEIVSKAEPKESIPVKACSDKLDLVEIIQKGSFSIDEINTILSEMITDVVRNIKDLQRQCSVNLQRLGLKDMNSQDVREIFENYCTLKDRLDYSQKKLLTLKAIAARTVGDDEE